MEGINYEEKIAKLASIVLALLTFLGAVLPTAKVSAAPADGPTDVVITKVKLDDLSGWPKGGGGDEYNGTRIVDFDTYFGAGAEVLPGVAFRVYKGSDATGEEVAGGPFITGENGTVQIPNLPNGTYYFVEDKEESTYVGSDGEVLTDAAAVPFTLTLPVAKADGTGYFGTGDDALFVYPKNTTVKPEVTKDFTDATATNETRSYTIGDTIPYTVTTKIPAKSAYKTLTWGDTMTDGLSYNKDLAITANGGLALTADDYTLTQTNQGFTLSFKDSGLTKLETAAKTAEVTISLTYSATINKNAIVDSPDKNHLTLKYGNGPEAGNTPINVQPENGQLVVTKTWAEGAAPAGARAILDVQNAQTGAVVQTVTLNAGNNWTATITGLDNSIEYRVVERFISGYAPEYSSTGNGNLSVRNVKNSNPAPVEPETPLVESYGRKFAKISNDLDGEPLANAQFVIEQNGKFLALKTEGESATELSAYQNAQAAYLAAVAAATNNQPNIDGIAALKATRDQAFAALKGHYTWVDAQKDALVLVSDINGAYEITGLKAGNYNLVEIKAPAGFALLTAPQPFTVAKGTYDAVRMTIDNKVVTIPETGGIGTVIFTVVGLLLMVGAVIAFKRSEGKEA